jgi:hypothetical protein
METTSNISPWLHSIQRTSRTSGLFTTIDDHVLRVRTTRKKINSILNTIYGLEEKLGVPVSSYGGRIGDMLAIRDAIGVYGIYHPTHSRREKEPNMIWYKEGLSSERKCLPNKEGGCWFDYFGKDDGITEVGGYVTVSLSHSGILYLNSIAERVSSLSSSYDSVTV